jgi:CheY-like chemotaxis protein
MNGMAGRTIALVAVSAELVVTAAAAIEAAGGEWQAFGRPPEAAKLRAFDAIITGAENAGELEAANVPLLLAGPADVKPPHDFILLPARADEIRLRLERLLSQTAAKPARVAAATPVVLAADDDPTTTAILRAVLTRHGMECRFAHDGNEAIELARSIRPDAIVLDVNMPHRDGYEVLSAIREDPSLAGVPILMLTSMQQESDIVKGFRLGADDYVAKPFSPMELLARIQRLVRRE